jgi:CRISPR-associated protein (Cas_Cas02710)
MRNNLSQAIQVFFNAETLLPFFIGSLFLAILGNSIYDILKNWIGTDTASLLRIAGIALLIFILAVSITVYTVNRRSNRLKSIIPGTRPPRQFRGLILLVSRAEPCLTAIKYHLPTLQQCWLICSSDTLKTTQQLINEYPHICANQPIIINDIHDPIEYRNAITKIYENHLPKGWTDQDVIADYTGMTAHGSVGMVLACMGLNRPLQYVPVATDANQEAFSLDPIEITLD